MSAAKASHPTNRQDHPKRPIKQPRAGNFPPDDRPLFSEKGSTTSWEEDLRFIEENPSPHKSRNRRQKSYDVQRWRIIAEKSSNANCLGGNQKDRLHGEHPIAQDNATAHTSIPIYKGNSDPFNSTSVPFTALDLTLVEDDRASMADLVWPAEITMRKNRQSIIDEIWKFMPSILSSPTIAHSIISRAHYSMAVRYQVLGRRDQYTLTVAEKHEGLALRGVRELLETYQRSGNLNLLRQIFAVSGLLGTGSMISGNVNTSQMHYAAVKRMLDLTGGLKRLTPMETEACLFSKVSCAWLNRTRPAFHPDEWDPGSWSQFRMTLTDTLPVASDSDPKFHWQTSHPISPEPSSISPKVRIIIDQFREVLNVENIKPDLASSEGNTPEQVFRWSSLRKIALGARGIFLWCDLRDAIQSASGASNSRTSVATISPVSFDMITCLVTRCLERAILEEHYYINNSSFRVSKVYLAEIAAHLRRLARPFPFDDKGYDESDRLRILEDERRFDMLWVYSVGSHVEYCHTNLPEWAPFSSATLGYRQQDVSGEKRPFSVRFSRLVKILQFATFEDVTTFLSQKYLYCPRVQDEGLRKLVDV